LSFSVVLLMLRFGIPFDVWLRQPDGVIETAIRLCNEQSDGGKDGTPHRGYSG